jgi:hypothetical protein
MPIVVNEIVISVTVKETPSPNSGHNVTATKEEIIKECVEEVMAIIRTKNER